MITHQLMSALTIILLSILIQDLPEQIPENIDLLNRVASLVRDEIHRDLRSLSSA
jgi:hypothetical protein